MITRDSRIIRHLQSHHRTPLERQGSVVCNQEYYYDTDRRKLVLRVIKGLANREIERPIRGGGDWTRHYDWALAVQHREPHGDWVVESRFFFWQLPRRLCSSQPLGEIWSKDTGREIPHSLYQRGKMGATSGSDRFVTPRTSLSPPRLPRSDYNTKAWMPSSLQMTKIHGATSLPRRVSSISMVFPN